MIGQLLIDRAAAVLVDEDHAVTTEGEDVRRHGLSVLHQSFQRDRGQPCGRRVVQPRAECCADAHEIPSGPSRRSSEPDRSGHVIPHQLGIMRESARREQHSASGASSEPAGA